MKNKFAILCAVIFISSSQAITASNVSIPTELHQEIEHAVIEHMIYPIQYTSGASTQDIKAAEQQARRLIEENSILQSAKQDAITRLTKHFDANSITDLQDLAPIHRAACLNEMVTVINRIYHARATDFEGTTHSKVELETQPRYPFFRAWVYCLCAPCVTYCCLTRKNEYEQIMHYGPDTRLMKQYINNHAHEAFKAHEALLPDEYAQALTNKKCPKANIAPDNNNAPITIPEYYGVCAIAYEEANVENDPRCKRTLLPIPAGNPNQLPIAQQDEDGSLWYYGTNFSTRPRNIR